MLAKDTDAPFDNDDWIFEIKWDGYRAIAEVNKTIVRLYSRNGNSFAYTYPTVVEALSKMKLDAVFDGEIVVLNEEGHPDFQKLQQFEMNPNLPMLYYVFDLLKLNGKELYDLPLIERKEKLKAILPASDIVKYSDHIEGQGVDFFDVIAERNLEGIMAKCKTSRYYPGKRSPDWLKIKQHKTDEAIIVGFTEPRGGRKYFGAVVLGAYINGKLSYIGHSGSGFDEKKLKQISALLEPIVVSKSPFTEKVKTNMPVTWVKPQYVCEVKFTEWTSDNKLRHPIFLRMRDDKAPKDVQPIIPKTKGEALAAGEDEEPAVQEAESNQGPVKKSSKKASQEASSIKPKKDVIDNEKEKIYKFGKVEVKTTNRTKIFFPDEGVTKGDVIDYYEQMADYIIPHIKDRPESLFRTPNGIHHSGFFQKDAGVEAPSWVKHVPLFSESTNKDIDYILCNDKATLLYLANLGCIEINPWHSRLKSLDKPDYLIIDIDPSDNNTFDQVVEAAQIVKQVLDQAGAFSIPKTSGASGLHIYVPLGAKYTYDQAKDFANVICMMASAYLPDFTTLERNLKKRSKDKIYMDYLQNRKGQTIACVYSMRPKKGATVSTPLEWDEVVKGLSPLDFTYENTPARVAKKGDLFAPMLDKKNAIDLKKCIERLGG